jgi:hypothetical protein
MGEGPKPRKKGKNKEEQPIDGGAPSFAPPPPPEDQAAPSPSSPHPYDGGMTPPSSQPMGDEGRQRERDGKPKKKKDKGCPEGMVALDDDRCAPPQ